VHEARRLIVPVTTVESWLDRQALALERGACMMAAVGTAGFFEQGRQLYGEPTAPLRYIHLTPLALAQSVLDTITQLTKIEIRTEPPAYHSAETVAAQLADAVRVHFGEQAPAIERAGSAETTVGSRDRDPDGDRRADFLEVYAFFMERTGDADQAFESARRVFRGGVLTGGALFTKDVVYLMGLMSVNYFIRGAFAAGRADCLGLLFCGKLDLFDIPALCELYDMGLCRPPRFLPPWISDPRYLLGLLTFATFVSRFDLGPLVEVATRLLDSAPLVRMPMPGDPIDRPSTGRSET
jgi:hypothetical protein